MAIERAHGAEQPYWPMGPFKLRLPLIHYRWEYPEMIQGLIMFVVGLAMIPLLQKYLAMPYEAALAFCVIAGIGYMLPALLGVPLVPGWITPAIYAFGEASGNARDYTNAPYNSRGYRAIAGVGSDRISLFRGEVYAGVQQQFYRNGIIGTASSPVIGGQIYWYPTRWITVRAALDQTFTDSSLPSPANPNGYPSKATTVRLSAVFKPFKDFTATWRASYEHTTYLASARRDNGWRTGIEAGYHITHNIELLGSYEFSKIYSTDAFGGYTRNSVSLGMKYRY